MSQPATAVEPYEECGECGHYPAYCRPGGKGCSAWNPDKPKNKCDCKGRKPPKPKAVPPPESA